MTPNEIIEILQAWKDGKRLQWKNPLDTNWHNYNKPECPKFFINIIYRIRPPEKTKVKYYKFLCKNLHNLYFKSQYYYKTIQECSDALQNATVLYRIDNSMIEIEEDS